MEMNTDAQRHMKHDVIIQLPFIIKYAMRFFEGTFKSCMYMHVYICMYIYAYNIFLEAIRSF